MAVEGPAAQIEATAEDEHVSWCACVPVYVRACVRACACVFYSDTFVKKGQGGKSQ